MTLPVVPIDGRPCGRIIPSRFRPIQRFERVTEPDERAAIFERDSLTKPQLRHEAGDISLVPPEDRITGPGTSIIMAASTHRSPDGSGVADGTFGVSHAANDLETAIAETKFHRARFMRATAQAPMALDRRVHVIGGAGNLHDLKEQTTADPRVRHNDNGVRPLRVYGRTPARTRLARRARSRSSRCGNRGRYSPPSSRGCRAVTRHSRAVAPPPRRS
jgi:hypothetical protein